MPNRPLGGRHRTRMSRLCSSTARGPTRRAGRESSVACSETAIRVVAPPNPLRGLAADSAYLASYLSTISGPVILVGHSYGGAVITNAATGNVNVKALVYVDAFAPDQGESVGQLVNALPGSVLAGDPTPVFNVVADPALPAGDVDLYFKASVFHADFAADISDAKSAELAATQRPLAVGVIGELSGDPAWKHVPSWYLVGTADKVIPLAEQLAMAQRAGSHISQVNSSHVSLISQPDAVVRLIEDASHAIR